VEFWGDCRMAGGRTGEERQQDGDRSADDEQSRASGGGSMQWSRGHCSVKMMNAFRAATRLAPRAAAQATGSFQQQTASSELVKSGRGRYAGRDDTSHASAVGHPIAGFCCRTVCTLPTDNGDGAVLRLGEEWRGDGALEYCLWSGS